MTLPPDKRAGLQRHMDEIARRLLAERLERDALEADRGPRLPTLFAALGAERVRELLTPPPA